MAWSRIWQDRVIFAAVADHSPQGALQSYSLTCRQALHDAYQVVNWESIDMGQWPFALREIKKVKKQAKYRDALEEYQRAKEAYERAHPPNADGTFHMTIQAIRDMPVPLHQWESDDEVMRIGLPGFRTFGDEADSRRDDMVEDKDLIALMARLPAARLVEFRMSSPCVTDVGLANALHSQCASLQTLLLGSGRHGGQLTGCCLPALPSLRSLELHRIPFKTLAPQLDEKLEELCIYSETSEDARDGGFANCIAAFKHLRVLKLACKDVNTRLPESSLLRIFESCAQLQVVDIYTVANVSSQLLAHIAAHNQSLTEFTGCSDELDDESDAIQQFKAHYPLANVFIDYIDPSSNGCVLQ